MNRFLGLTVTRTHPAQTGKRTLFLVNTKSKRQGAKGVAQVKGAKKSQVQCLSSLKAFSTNYGFCSAARPIKQFISEKSDAC